MTAAPLPLARTLRAYLLESKYATIAALRSPGFAIPFILVPAAIYVLFGVVVAGAASNEDPGIADYLYCGFAAMAAMMPGLFSGVLLATEREGRVLKLKRSLPQPPGATVVAKILMSMAVAAIAVTLVAAAALVSGKTTLAPAQHAIVWGVLVVGTIPFTAIGLLIGTFGSAAAAPAWGNLVFLPMIWLSGLFIPLPDSLERWVVLWPAFHLDQLALGLAGVSRFTFIAPSIAGAALLGVTVACGGFAIRRLARIG